MLQRNFPGRALRRDVADLLDLPEETELLAAGFPCPVGGLERSNNDRCNQHAIYRRILAFLPISSEQMCLTTVKNDIPAHVNLLVV